MFVTKMINVELKTSNTIRNTKRKTFYYVVNKMFFSFVFPGTTYIIKCFSLCISRHDFLQYQKLLSKTIVTEMINGIMTLNIYIII